MMDDDLIDPERSHLSFDGKTWVPFLDWNYSDIAKYYKSKGVIAVWINNDWVNIDTLTNFEKELYNIGI